RAVGTVSCAESGRATRVRVRGANRNRGGGTGSGGTTGGRAGGGATTPPPPPTSAGGAPSPPATPSLPAGTGFFGPTSIWNAAVSPTAALDPNSGALVGDLVRQVNSWGPWINTDQYSTP